MLTRRALIGKAGRVGAVLAGTRGVHQQSVALSPDPDSHTIDNLGTVGATSSVSMDPSVEMWVTATLGTDHVSTITPAAGGSVKYFLLQDAGGGHTFTVSDGTVNRILPVATAAGASTYLAVYSPDGTDLWIGS